MNYRLTLFGRDARPERPSHCLVPDGLFEFRSIGASVHSSRANRTYGMVPVTLVLIDSTIQPLVSDL